MIYWIPAHLIRLWPVRIRKANFHPSLENLKRMIDSMPGTTCIKAHINGFWSRSPKLQVQSHTKFSLMLELCCIGMWTNFVFTIPVTNPLLCQKRLWMIVGYLLGATHLLVTLLLLHLLPQLLPQLVLLNLLSCSQQLLHQHLFIDLAKTVSQWRDSLMHGSLKGGGMW